MEDCPTTITDISSRNNPSFKTIKFILHLMLGHPFATGAVVLLSIVAACSELLTIALIMPFIESLRGNENGTLAEQIKLIGFLSPYFEKLELINKIRLIAILLLVVEMAKSAFRFTGGALSAQLAIKITAFIQMQVIDQLLFTGRGFLHRQKMSNLYTILNTFTYNTGAIVTVLMTIIPDLFMVLVILTILFSISVPMTLTAMVLTAGITVSFSHFNYLAQLVSKKTVQVRLSLAQKGIEILSGMDIVRLFGRQGTVKKDYAEQVDNIKQLLFKQEKIKAIISPLFNVLLVLMVTVILVISTFFLQKNAEFWLGILLMFLVVLSRLGGPLARINLARTKLVAFFPPVQELQKFLLEAKNEHLIDGIEEFEELKGEIVFDRVSFDYGSGEQDVLKEVSFKIPRNRMTAIVGASGSGKSTVVSLLGRLHDPTNGAILVDGLNLTQIKSSSWHDQIRVVSQSVFLFNNTIYNNIRFGAPEATDEEVKQAAIKANAHEFILEMKDGYDTVVGDRGVRLSGGQGQRVSIARAILIQPQLLILDEATSSLDSQSEKLVQDAIHRIKDECTLLVVAHRLSTIQEADNIIVLHDGRVVEEGVHKDLIERKGQYWEFAQLQDVKSDK